MKWEPELLKYTNKVERLAEVYGVPYDHNGHLEAFAQSLVHRELRDHFAGLAMQGLLASPVMGDCALHNSSADWLKDITKCSYDFADFMMVYREKRDDT